MKLTDDIKAVVEQLETDLVELKKSQSRIYLSEYEEGYTDGSVDTFEAAFELVKAIQTKVEKLQKEYDEVSSELSWTKFPETMGR